MRFLSALLGGAIGVQAACSLCPMPPLNITGFLTCLKPAIGEECCSTGRPLVTNPCVKVWLASPMLAPYLSVVEKARVACKVDQLASCEASVARTCPTECGAPVTPPAAAPSAKPAGKPSTPAQRCGANEEYTECGSSSCWEPTCKGGVLKTPGPVCTDDCRQGCKCASGYARDTGKCIPSSQCKPSNPVCGANEEYTECTSSSCWEPTCKGGLLQTPGPICTADCKQGCKCASGYARDSTGKCISESQCKPSNPACGAHEEYTECTSSSCWEPTCKGGLWQTPGPVCTADCKRGCKCASGYARDSTGKCISESQCKPTSPVCKANEEFEDCGSSSCFEDKCVNRQVVKPGPMCTFDCRQGCKCAEGFARASNGQCVTAAQCQKRKGKLPKAPKNGKKGKQNSA